MNRKAFALSWGRKIFFGLGWVLISIVGLSFLQSKILPHGPMGWFFFLTSFIGHYGLIVSLLYFVFYYPIIWALPNYYASRMWSMLLIVASCLLLGFDSILFTQYRFHANSFILDLIFGGGSDSLKSFPTSGYILLFVGITTVSLIIWVRGEFLWRSMQGRFSNPVKNWYLVLILICLGISHGMHIYGDANYSRSITRLTQLFPLYYPSTAKGLMSDYGMVAGNKASDPNKGFTDFYYPSREPTCKDLDNKNILFIIVDKMKPEDISKEKTPAIEHFKTHGVSYENHYSGSNNSRGGLYSLFYSLPTTYWTASRNNQAGPMLIQELKKRQYDIGIFSSLPIKDSELDKTVFLNVEPVVTDNTGYEKNIVTTESWKKWVNAHINGDPKKSFFGTIIYDVVDKNETISSTSATEPGVVIEKPAITQIDGLIKSVVDDLYRKDVLQDTIIIITANHAADTNLNEIEISQVKVPLIGIYPEKKKMTIDEMTSHYDVVPTLMSKVWNCKDSFKDYSYGSSLFSHENKSWLIVGSDEMFGVLDFQRGLIISIQSSGKYHVTDFSLNPVPKHKARESVVFEVLKSLTRFHHK